MVTDLLRWQIPVCCWFRAVVTDSHKELRKLYHLSRIWFRLPIAACRSTGHSFIALPVIETVHTCHGRFSICLILSGSHDSKEVKCIMDLGYYVWKYRTLRGWPVKFLFYTHTTFRHDDNHPFKWASWKPTGHIIPLNTKSASGKARGEWHRLPSVLP